MLGIYIRLSKEDADSNSIENQKRQGLQFAKGNKLKHKIYNEGEGLSGGLGIDSRPMLKSLLDDVNNDKITTIWVRDQSRLERNTELWFSIINILRDKEVKLYNSDKFIDLHNDEELFPTHIMSLINDMQRKKQGRLTKRSINDNFKQGKAHGMTPYGYTTDKDRYLIIDDKEAAIVKEIFELSLIGMGTNKIAIKLDSMGVPTRYSQLEGTRTTRNKKSGKLTTINKSDIKWSGASIMHILKNTMYKGLRGTQFKSNPEYYKCPVIIDEKLWQSAQDNLAKNRTFSGAKEIHNYLLKNVIRCGACGRNYVGRTRKKKKEHRYLCSSNRIKDHTCNNKSINIDRIEELVWGAITKTLPEHVEEYFKANSTDEIKETIESDLLKLEQQHKTVKARLNKLIDAMLDGTFTNEEIKGKKKTLNTQLDSIKIKIANLKERRQSIEDELLSLDLINKDVSKKSYSFEEKKELIQKYVSDVKVIYYASEDSIKDYYDRGEYFVFIYLKNTELDNILYVVERGYKNNQLIKAGELSSTMSTILLKTMYSEPKPEHVDEDKLNAIFKKIDTIATNKH